MEIFTSTETIVWNLLSLFLLRFYVSAKLVSLISFVTKRIYFRTKIHPNGF